MPMVIAAGSVAGLLYLTWLVVIVIENRRAKSRR